MTSPKRFFMLGGYLSYNPGDLAILKATANRLDQLHPGSHFVIWCDKPGFSAALTPDLHHEYFAHRCPSFFMGVGLLPKFLLRLYLLSFPFSQRVIQLLEAKKNRAAVQMMRSCDHILFIGGGYLNSNYPFDLMQLHYLYGLAKESGRPIYLMGQTTGPFKNRWHRNIVRSMVQGAAKVVTREKYSLADLSSWSANIVQGVDDALSFSVASAGRSGESVGDEVVLGLNLRHAKQPTDYSRLVEALNQFNMNFAGNRLKVVYIPMVTSAHSDDRAEAAKFEAIPGKNFPLEMFSGPLTVESRFSAIAKTDLFLGMRFHSLVFALSNGVPCASLYSDDYYFRKNYGLFEIYGLERYCLKTDSFGDLSARLGEMLRNRPALHEDLQKKHQIVLRGQETLYRSLFN